MLHMDKSEDASCKPINDIRQEVAEAVGITPKIIKEITTVFIEKIIEAIDNGNTVVVPKLGTFVTVMFTKRKGRNLHTGEPMIIPERRQVKFAVNSSLKKRVKDNPDGKATHKPRPYRRPYLESN